MGTSKIIIGTTPTITYKFKVVDVASITVAILTINERGVNIIELNLSDATIGEDSLSWTLTQEETLQIGVKTCTMMLNWLTADGTRGVSPKETINVTNNDIAEVMTP